MKKMICFMLIMASCLITACTNFSSTPYFWETLETISKILTIRGFVIAAVIYFIGAQTGFSNYTLIVGGGVIAILFAIPGLILDVVWSLRFSKEYKQYQANLK